MAANEPAIVLQRTVQGLRNRPLRAPAVGEQRPRPGTRGQLVDLLGATQSQAEGGAGAIFKAAKDNMSTGDYSQLLSAVPGIDSLISSAPEGSGLAGKATSLFGGSSESMKGTAALADSFSKLGLSPDMIGKYTDIILDFVQSEAGQQTMTLVKNALL